MWLNQVTCTVTSGSTVDVSLDVLDASANSRNTPEATSREALPAFCLDALISIEGVLIIEGVSPGCKILATTVNMLSMVFSSFGTADFA